MWGWQCVAFIRNITTWIFKKRKIKSLEFRGKIRTTCFHIPDFRNVSFCYSALCYSHQGVAEYLIMLASYSAYKVDSIHEIKFLQDSRNTAPLKANRNVICNVGMYNHVLNIVLKIFIYLGDWLKVILCLILQLKLAINKSQKKLNLLNPEKFQWFILSNYWCNWLFRQNLNSPSLIMIK